MNKIIFLTAILFLSGCFEQAAISDISNNQDDGPYANCEEQDCYVDLLIMMEAN